jgi:alanine-glyoxylate transaminase/(R)-3-amino-2-methylpropionate-pyruvate transaminase
MHASTPPIGVASWQSIHFNTYGGNAVSMAAGLATLDVILEENIQQHAHEIGAHLREGLDDLHARHPMLGDVRGRGLMMGLEIVTDRESNHPATADTNAIFERCRELGLLVGKGGLEGNVIRLKPPMCWTRADVEFACDVFDRALTEVEAAHR